MTVVPFDLAGGVVSPLFLSLSPGGIAGIAGVTLLVGFSGILALLRNLQRQKEERARAERELSHHKTQPERIIDSLGSCFLYGRDREGRLTHASDSVRRVLGLSPQDFCARYAMRFPAVPGHLETEKPPARWRSPLG